MTSKAEEYEICKRRGHQASGMVLTSMPPWDVCKWCGTAYHYDRKLVEMDVPADAIVKAET